jgi:hypothetical protein
MSSYGPQGGPYPGQPQDPWQDGSANDPYRSGYPDPLTESGYNQAAHTNHSPPTGYQPGYGQYGGRPGPAPGSITGEVWGPAQAPPRGGRSGTAIGVIIVVVLLALGGAAVAAVFLTRGDGGTPTADPSTGPSSASAGPSSPSTSASAANSDAKVAKAGDCLVNKGSAEKPDMQKVACAANTYQVLKRIDGTADKNKCEGTANLTDWYFFDHSDNAQDFVLCLRKR